MAYILALAAVLLAQPFFDGQLSRIASTYATETLTALFLKTAKPPNVFAGRVDF
jgi:hypothetical protein